MKVEAVMTKNPACCTPDMDLAHVAQLMLKYDCGEIPVVYSMKDKKVLGVITDRDICVRSVAFGFDPKALQVNQCMSYPAIVASIHATIEDCCKILEEYQIRRLPVVDDEQNCCGMISVADIARFKEGLDECHLAGEVIKLVSQPGSARWRF